MVLTYTCIRKCFFLDGMRRPGDRLILDTTVGDACCHLVRTPTEEQLAMQAQEEKKENTEALAVPKAAGAKVVPTAKKKMGARKNDQT